jgi:tetratricopeptide (TPR) repeat protein
MSGNRLEEGHDLAHVAYEQAVSADQPLWAARARITEAQRFLILREHVDAVSLLQDALRLLRRVDAPLLVARARSALAVVGMGSGRHEEARAQLARAREAYEAVGDMEGLGRCAMLEGVTWEQSGDLDEAREAFLLALRYYGEAGAPIGRTAAHNGLAMNAMVAGDLATASMHMDRSVELARAYGGMPVDVLLMDGASIELAAGRVEAARAMLEGTIGSLRAMGQKVRTMQCHGRLLDAVVRLGDRPAAIRCLDEAEPLLALTVTERHLAMHLSAAGRQLVALGWRDEARRAWTLAHHQWSALQDTERTAEAEAALQRLEP